MRDLLRKAFFVLLLRPFVRWVLGLRVEGARNIPAADPFLLVANHDSHLDALVLLCLFPAARQSRIRAVAAADYWQGSAVRRFVSGTLLGVLPVVRGAQPGADPLAPLSAALASGTSLLLFPEGTRGDPEVLLRFKSGAARLSIAHPEVPVVPAFLRNAGRSLPRGSPLLVPLVCEVSVGEPVALYGGARERTAQLEAAVRALVPPAPSTP